MFLRKLGKRGAEMVEYAIVLACIAAVGVGFYSSNDSKLTGVLDSLFGNVRQVLGLEAASSKYFTIAGDEDIKYVATLNSIIDGLNKEYGSEESPLHSVNYDKNGKVTGYSLYNLSDLQHPIYHSNINNGLDLNTLLPSNSQYKVGGKMPSVIQFTKEGKVDSWSDNDWNKTTRIYLTDKSTSNGDLAVTYSKTSNTVSATRDHWMH